VFGEMNALSFNRDMSDDSFWAVAASKPFYAGHRAADVQLREKHMLDNYLGDWPALCGPEWDIKSNRYNEFLSDQSCFRNEPDLQLVIFAARRMRGYKTHNPQRTMIDHFFRQLNEWESTQSLRKIHERMLADLRFGLVTTFHLMTELGLSVVKPDRVVNRIAARMGLIERYKVGNYTHFVEPTISTQEATQLGQKAEFNWALQDECRRIAEAAGVTMRLLDFMIVKLGQEPDELNGFARTICSENNPRCDLCGVKPMCAYGSKR
jgi:DNA-3-methyladenine glycosylase I